MDIKKRVVISGGTSGIGLATADILSKEGWETVLIGRNEARGRLAEKEVANSIFIPCDVRKKEDLTQLAEKIKKIGEIYGIVSSAGIYKEGLLENVKDEEIKELFDINVFGTIRFIRELLPFLKKGKGSIVTVASDAAIQGNVQGSLYSATKGAVTAFTRSLALELATDGIRANVVCPGDVRTPLLENQLKIYGGTTEEMENLYPLMRIAEPEEIGNVIAFLLSERASFITGAIIPADGGLTDW